MTFEREIEKVRESIREVEDPAVAMALRHVCSALEKLQREEKEEAGGGQERLG